MTVNLGRFLLCTRPNTAKVDKCSSRLRITVFCSLFQFSRVLCWLSSYRLVLSIYYFSHTISSALWRQTFFIVSICCDTTYQYFVRPSPVICTLVIINHLQQCSILLQIPSINQIINWLTIMAINRSSTEKRTGAYGKAEKALLHQFDGEVKGLYIFYLSFGGNSKLWLMTHNKGWAFTVLSSYHMS